MVDPEGSLSPVERWCWDSSCTSRSLDVSANGLEGDVTGDMCCVLLGPFCPRRMSDGGNCSSSYSEPQAGREPRPICCVGQRAGGGVGGVCYSRSGEERGAVESLEASSRGSTSCSAPSFPATRGGRGWMSERGVSVPLPASHTRAVAVPGKPRLRPGLRSTSPASCFISKREA